MFVRGNAVNNVQLLANIQKKNDGKGGKGERGVGGWVTYHSGREKSRHALRDLEGGSVPRLWRLCRHLQPLMKT